VLDEMVTLEQSKGWPSNTVKAIHFTADSNGKIPFADSVLNVHCVAPGRYQGNVVVQRGYITTIDSTDIYGPRAYIVSEGTDNFGADTDVYMDVIYQVDFGDAPVDLQWAILEAARKRLVLEKFRNPVMDGLMERDKAEADVYADRQSIDRRGVPKNTRPIGMSGGSDNG
jgi:hypothetical protein